MDPRIERAATRIRAASVAARMLVAPLIVADELSDSEVDDVTALFPEWATATAYAVNDLARHDDVLYRCVQAHTSQSDWSPPVVPALWTPVKQTQGATPDPWQQPAGAHDAYQQGDRVTFNGQTWESTINANVWAPGVHGWQVVT